MTPSDAARRLACPGSAALEEAHAGTLCHQIAAGMLTHGMATAPEGYGHDIQRTAEEYVGAVLESYHKAQTINPSAILAVEDPVETPVGPGRVDALIAAPPYIKIYDLKYGGRAVSACGNTQLRLYAIAALDKYDGKVAKMSVIQPRRGVTSSEVMTAAELEEWRSRVIDPASEGMNRCGLRPGQEQCQYCTAKAVCRMRARQALQVTRYADRPPEELTPAEIATVLSHAGECTRWLRDVQAYALQLAQAGVEIPGYQVVPGRTQRVYADEAGAREALLKAGYGDGDIMQQPHLVGIGKMQELVGDAFDGLIGPYLTRSRAKPALAPVKYGN